MIDWTHFTPLASAVGGLVIGAAAAMLIFVLRTGRRDQRHSRRRTVTREQRQGLASRLSAGHDRFPAALASGGAAACGND